MQSGGVYFGTYVQYVDQDSEDPVEVGVTIIYFNEAHTNVLWVI